MNKITTFVLSALLLGFTTMPSFALHGFTLEELDYKGFSAYMVELVELQESRQEDNKLLETPSTGKIFWENILQGDILIPTQKFGYSDIKESF